MTTAPLPCDETPPPPASDGDAGGGALSYEETTEGVRVVVRPVFLRDRSDPEEGQFLWAYHVRIENLGGDSVQLVSRRWSIVDGAGRAREVEGEGVVGEKPVLVPGGSFEYTSGAPLNTPSGFMGGGYGMRRPDGALFSVRVPTFSLDSPYSDSRRLH